MAGGAVAWKSRVQPLVALSSTEAEVIAVDDAARELRYLEKILADFGITAPRPTPIGQDNLSTCRLVGATSWNPRSKHMALRYHSTGDLQRAGVLQVKYLPTAAMPSDALTKPLARMPHAAREAQEGAAGAGSTGVGAAAAAARARERGRWQGSGRLASRGGRSVRGTRCRRSGARRPGARR